MGTVNPTDAQLAKIQSLQSAHQVAQDKADKEENLAYTRYIADVQAQASHQAFGAWITQHDPLLTEYNRQVQLANSQVQTYENSVYGPQYATIATQRNRIVQQADDNAFPEPGYVLP